MVVTLENSQTEITLVNEAAGQVEPLPREVAHALARHIMRSAGH